MLVSSRLCLAGKAPSLVAVAPAQVGEIRTTIRIKDGDQFDFQFEGLSSPAVVEVDNPALVAPFEDADQARAPAGLNADPLADRGGLVRREALAMHGAHPTGITQATGSFGRHTPRATFSHGQVDQRQSRSGQTGVGRANGHFQR